VSVIGCVSRVGGTCHQRNLRSIVHRVGHTVYAFIEFVAMNELKLRQNLLS
jgi:hypothetical protein